MEEGKIMEENKYYTPELSDFYIGYDYERSSYSGGAEEWDRIIVNGGDIEEIDNIFSRGEQSQKVRVPYLTKEQIEAEGFSGGRLLKHFVGEDTRRFYYGKYEMDFNEITRKLSILDPNNEQCEQDCDENYLYNAECKSINEFRTLMKWLNIKFKKIPAASRSEADLRYMLQKYFEKIEVPTYKMTPFEEAINKLQQQNQQ